MPDTRPVPDLADIPMKPVPSPRQVDRDEEPTGADPADPPAQDLTIPME